MSRRRLSPGPRTRAVTVLVVAASTVAVGSADAHLTVASVPQALPAQAAPAPDPSLLAALQRRHAAVSPATPVTPAPSSTTSEPTSATADSLVALKPASSAPASAMIAPGMPAVALAAYQNAQAALSRSRPTCRLSWALLAGIGTVESDNGQYGGATLGTDGVARPAIIGIALNGSAPGTSVVHDTGNGRWDGDPLYDHAVGPMQFLPGTWAAMGTSATKGRAADPENINDAALTAGIYLCATGNDLATPAGRRAAVLRYNDSASYADTVLALSDAYASGLLDPVITTASTPSGPSTATASAPAHPVTVIAAKTSRPSPTTTPTVTAATPSPSAAPTPSPSLASSPSPSLSDSVEPSPAPTDSPSPTPSDSAEPSPSPSDSAEPSPWPTDSPSATPTPTPTPTPTDSPSPSPIPLVPSSAGPDDGAPSTGPSVVVVDERVQSTDPRTVLVTWGPPTAAAPTRYLVTLQVFRHGTWRDLHTVTVDEPAARSATWVVPSGTYRASIVTVGADGQSDPAISTPLVVGQA
ncbi:MAG: hypothetical protein WAL50_10445 [Kineosporiaceae bacterium]